MTVSLAMPGIANRLEAYPQSVGPVAICEPLGADLLHVVVGELVHVATIPCATFVRVRVRFGTFSFASENVST